MQVSSRELPETVEPVAAQATLAPCRLSMVQTAAPLGTPAPGAFAVMPAVKVTGWPDVSGFVEDESEITESARSMVWLSWLAFDPLKSVEPE